MSFDIASKMRHHTPFRLQRLKRRNTLFRSPKTSRPLRIAEDQTVENGPSTDDGFGLADYNQQTVNTGIVGDLANPALVSQLPQDKTPLPANVATANGDVWFEMEGIMGSKNADVLRGDSAADPSAVVSHGDNRLVGGSGDDGLKGRGGTDLLVGISKLKFNYNEATGAGTLVNMVERPSGTGSAPSSRRTRPAKPATTTRRSTG